MLQISFPLSPELDQKLSQFIPTVTSRFQNIGSVYIAGMTVPEVVAALKKASANILHDPIIDVDLVDFQRAYFMVTGQVGKPGQYDLRHDTNVNEAIALAGGFLPTAKTQVFVYHRSLLAKLDGSEEAQFKRYSEREERQRRHRNASQEIWFSCPRSSSPISRSTCPTRRAFTPTHSPCFSSTWSHIHRGRQKPGELR